LHFLEIGFSVFIGFGFFSFERWRLKWNVGFALLCQASKLYCLKDFDGTDRGNYPCSPLLQNSAFKIYLWSILDHFVVNLTFYIYLNSCLKNRGLGCLYRNRQDVRLSYKRIFPLPSGVGRGLWKIPITCLQIGHDQTAGVS
jgi:hypothetical protein